MIARSFLFLSFLLLLACESEPKKRSGPDQLSYQLDTLQFGSPEKGLSFFVEDILIKDSGEVALSIQQQIDEHLVEGNVNFAQDFRTYQGLYETLLAERAELKAGGFESPVTWEMNQELSIYLNQNGLFGLSSYHMSYTGGAHPNSYRSSLLFRLYDGAALSIDSIVIPGREDLLVRLAEAKLRQQFEISETAKLNDSGFWFEGNQFYLSEHFEYSEEGLHFFYNPYEIGPYSLGFITILIPYPEIHEIIRPEYRFTLENQANT